MSDEPADNSDAPPKTEPAAAPMTRMDRIFVRLTFWQTVLSVAGVFIAIMALYAALTESAAVRQQTAASVWPFVQFSINDYDTGDTAGFTMSFTNAGVGPAKMKGVRLTINGSPVRDWADAVASLGGTPEATVGRSFISNRVLSPDETVAVITTMDPDTARRFQAAMVDSRNSIEYCYCSIFDDCWFADIRKDLQNPVPVEACPDFGDAIFQN